MTTPNQNTTTTQAPSDTAWQVEYAKRSLASLADDAKQALRDRLSAIRDALDEADRSLDEGRIPNECGILQSRAMEVEMALARVVALRDAQPAIEILTNAAEGASR